MKAPATQARPIFAAQHRIMDRKAKVSPVIPHSSFDFLTRLKDNNNREWFHAHKDRFLEEQSAIEAFAGALLEQLNTHDQLETPDGKSALQRIYRDTRFSKDKTPYKTYWGGGFRRATRYRRGGYYFHFEPGGHSFAGGGFWGPNAADLKLIREDIAFDPSPLNKVLNSRNFKAIFGTLQGEQLKKAPQGFDPAHEAIGLLRYKQFLLRRPFTDAEVLAPSFLKEVGQTYKHMRPFLDYMSGILGADANGLPL